MQFVRLNFLADQEPVSEMPITGFLTTPRLIATGLAVGLLNVRSDLHSTRDWLPFFGMCLVIGSIALALHKWGRFNQFEAALQLSEHRKYLATLDASVVDEALNSADLDPVTRHSVQRFARRR